MTRAQMERYLAARLALDNHRAAVNQLNQAGLALEKEYNEAFSAFQKLPQGVYLMSDGNAIVIRANGDVRQMPVVVSIGRGEIPVDVTP